MGRRTTTEIGVSGRVVRLRSNDPCWCGSGRKLKRCHGDHESARRPAVRPGAIGPRRVVPDGIVRPPYAMGLGKGNRGIQVFDQQAEIDGLRHAGRVAAEVLAITSRHVAPGVTTDELDEIAHDAYLRLGAYPSTLGYGSYVKSICTSVNEVVCHGIPDNRPLAEGDIVNVDVTAFVDGFHGDTSATVVVGSVDAATAALVDTTRGVAAVRPGQPIRAIGAAIQPFALSRGFGVVAEYGGHGIGRTFHADPHVSHVDEPSAVMRMVPGMVFTIEPMLTAGTARNQLWSDGWTVVTVDGLPSAQFEHTVIVTDDGAEVLTQSA